MLSQAHPDDLQLLLIQEPLLLFLHATARAVDKLRLSTGASPSCRSLPWKLCAECLRELQGSLWLTSKNLYFAQRCALELRLSDSGF